MSFTQQGIYGPRAPIIPPPEVSRSFNRFAIILGLSGTAFATYLAGCYLYRKFYPRDRVETTASGTEIRVSASKALAVTFQDQAALSPKDTKVILHQCPRGYYTPCIAPFSLKLETYLRVANIPYEVNRI